MRVTDDDLKDVIKLHLCKLHHMKQCQVWLLGLAIKVAPVLGSRPIQFYCSVYIISGVGFQETQFIFVLPAELTLKLHKVFRSLCGTRSSFCCRFQLSLQMSRITSSWSEVHIWPWHHMLSTCGSESVPQKCDDVKSPVQGPIVGH